ncbi:CBS domain-containing protein [Kribbella sp. GL6]|uniref:CBS domain-containing protein n=1 Tax=Kribbella sp. GL6 TaxID=3419765 RepID=UPI003D059505
MGLEVVPDPQLTGRTVADAMVRRPKLLGAATTVAEAHDFFADEHVHCALIVADRKLLAVVERSDLTSSAPNLAAVTLGSLDARVVRPDADLAATWEAMVTLRRRRLAVIDDDGNCLGLLCLKRSGAGFCSDTDVEARAAGFIERSSCYRSPAD